MKVFASALLIVAASGSQAQVQQEPLGRLFFTPEQRAVLERQKQHNQNSSALVDDGAPLTLNGRVTRSSGRNTAWINGTALDERDAAQTLSRTPLRPGETAFGPGKGEQTDVLNGGTIVIKR